MAQVAPFTPEPFGPYLLLSHLGRGGMADVFKARVEGVAGFARNIVVKRILKVHTQEPHFVEMFINEAKIAARLSHPNIVQVYELGEVNGELFIAMEYVRGVDLLRLMRTAVAVGGPPPPAVGAFVVREVARALSHAHDYVDESGAPRPIIHRDISPQNVMVAYDGQVKLVDFGIAKAVTAFQEGTRTGSLKGKFGYMAPEQIDSGNCTPQTDIFSVGVVLFEVLTAKRLFKGQTDYDTMNKVKHAPLVTPSSVQAGVDPDLDRVVLTALQRDSTQRYQRAGQMARDLESYLQKVGFSQEDLAAWLKQTLPREDTPSPPPPGAGLSGTPSRSHTTGRSPVGVGTGAGPGGTGRLGSGTTPRPPESLGDLAGGAWQSGSPSRSVARGQAVPQSTTPVASAGPAGPDPPPIQSGRRPAGALPLIGGGALLIVSTALVMWILRAPSGPTPGPGPTPPPPRAPEVHATTPPETRPNREAREARDERETRTAVQDPAAPRALSVRLESDPQGATVYAGPRRLGQTPLALDLVGESLEILLSYPGRPDLLYTVRRGEGSQLVLRLPDGRKARKGRGREDPALPTSPVVTSPGPAPVPDTRPAVVTPVTPPQPVQPQKRLQVKPLDEDDPPVKGGVKPLE